MLFSPFPLYPAPPFINCHSSITLPFLHTSLSTVHIASGDLTMYKRTLSPLKSLIYGLRRYDLDRCIAQANPRAPGYDEKKVVGFMSHKSKIYLVRVSVPLFVHLVLV